MNRLLMPALLLALCCTSAPCAEKMDPEEQRQEALKTLLYPWSDEAKTKDLNLSEDGTLLLNRWLDFCRNTYGGRAKSSDKLKGTPEAEWDYNVNKARSDGDLGLIMRLVTVRVYRSSFSLQELPDLLKACYGPDYLTAVRVEGDDDKLLNLWAIMLTTHMAEQAEQARDDGVAPDDLAAWDEAYKFAFGKVSEQWESSPQTKVFKPDPGTTEATRMVIIAAIGRFGGADAGALLKKVYERAKGERSIMDQRYAVQALASTPTPEGAQCIIDELGSNDGKRQLAVLGFVRAGCDKKLEDKVNGVAKSTKAEADVRKAAVGALRRIGLGKADSALEARKDIATLFKTLKDGDVLKDACADALVEFQTRTDYKPKDDAAQKYLEKQVTTVGEHSPRGKQIKRLLDELKESQIGK